MAVKIESPHKHEFDELDKLALKESLMTSFDRKAFNANKVKQLEAENGRLLFESMVQSLHIDTHKLQELNLMKQREKTRCQSCFYFRSSYGTSKPKTSFQPYYDYSLSSDSDDSDYESMRSSSSGSSCSSNSSGKSMLSIESKPNKKIAISVQVLSRKSKAIAVQVPEDCTVLQLKEDLWGKIPARPSQQELFFQKQQLRNAARLSYYGITNSSKLTASVFGKSED